MQRFITQFLLLFVIITLFNGVGYASSGPTDIGGLQIVPASTSTDVPDTENANATGRYTYQLENTGNVALKYKITNTSSATTAAFIAGTCAFDGAITRIDGHSSCTFSVNVTAPSTTTASTNYTVFNLATNLDQGGTNWGVTYATTATTPVTVTISGNLVTDSPTTAVPVTLTQGSSSTGTVNITADGVAHTFGNIAAGNYTAAPTNVTVNGVKYHLQSSSVTVPNRSTSYNITLEYDKNNPPASTTPVTVTITGDLKTEAPTTQVDVKLSSSSQSYGPTEITADGGAHNLANVLPGTYTAAPASVMVGATEYDLQSSGVSVPAQAASYNVTLEYDKYTPPVGGYYNWQKGHLQAIKDANVFAIVWGGGSTTAPVHIGTNPPANQWLIDQIGSYENGNTLPVEPTATVQQFPSYIAMGSVTATSSEGSETNQLKSQKLDSTFHYEGNGAGDRGCFFDNAAGLNVSMTAASDTVGTISTAGSYYIIAGYYLWIDKSVTPNVTHYYKGSVDVTQTSSNQYNLGVTYTETTSAITSAPDLSLLKSYTFPAGVTITYSATGPNFADKFAPPTINVNPDGLCHSIWYTAGSYTPEVSKMAAQAQAVKAATGHQLIPAEVFYTIDMSDGTSAIQADTETDLIVIPHLYNLMYEATLLEAQQQAGTPMALYLNPDSVYPFQTCAQYNCPVAWRPGISNDPDEGLITIPNLLADVKAALDRMQTEGHLTAAKVTAMKADLVSSGILTPPASSKRGQTPGLPELVLVNNWLMKSIAPDVPFGWGLNGYDNNNPLLTPGGAAEPWETASITWLHKVNHLGLSHQDWDNAVETEGTKLANYLTEMNMVGSNAGKYKPDFIYFDKYERDPIPGYVDSGFVFNGVDWDTYLQYIKDTDTLVHNIPVAIWQMPGASLQTSSSYTANLAATVPDWVFGDPDLNLNLSNVVSSIGLNNLELTSNEKSVVYYVDKSNVNNVQEYLTLTAADP